MGIAAIALSQKRDGIPPQRAVDVLVGKTLPRSTNADSVTQRL